MLLMNSKALTIEGVTVFPDHADPDQFWYLPAPVALAERDGTPQFTLIQYHPAVADGGVQGGGFLTMEVELKLDPEVERKIINALSGMTEGRPRLSVVPFDEGTVQVIALNIQGSGGTTAPRPVPGAFVAVESILGASKPSLAGNNNAVFSLALSQEGSIILDQAFRQGAMPVGILYDLKYTALRPALDVELTANFKRIYDHLSMGIDLTAGAVIYGVPVFLEAGIDLAFEKLKQDGVIQVKVINFSDAADQADKEKWALDFFKEFLLAEWFKPTLPPVTFDTPAPAASGRPPTGTTTTGTTGGAAASPAAAAAAAAGAAASAATGALLGGGAGSTQPASGAAAPASGGAAPASGGAAPAPRPAGGGELGLLQHNGHRVREVWALPFSESGRAPASLTKRVEPQVGGYDIQLTQSADSDQVTLRFMGGQTPPTVRIDQAAQTLSPQREVTLSLAAGQSLSIEADYPAEPAVDQEFRLFFDFDKPREAGWSSNPPSESYRGYQTNRTSPLDTRFQTTTGPTNTAGGSTGAEALRAWLSTTLGSPKRVTVDAHASFENDVSKADHNQRLTQRRLDVALGIIGSSAAVTSSAAHGFDVARAAGRASDPNDRVVLIRGASSGGQAVSIRGTLSRAAGSTNGGNTGTTTTTTPPRPTPAGQPPAGQPPAGQPPAGQPPAGQPPAGQPPAGQPPAGRPPVGQPPTGQPPTGQPPAGQNPAIPGLGNTPPMGIKLAFSLKKIEQIEDKSVTIRYNRQSTIQRTYAPQGLIRLLADDLVGPPHFITVDLDHPFFRKLELEIEAPAIFEQIGLLKSDVAIDYGRLSEPATLKHKDISFRPGGTRVEKASFFLNSQLDLSYSYGLQYHFDPLSGWDGEKLSYDLLKTVTLDRTLLVNPFKDFGFLNVQIVPGDLDPGMIDSTDVHLHYEDPGKWSRDKVITVKPDSPVQAWKLRLSDPERTTFTYRFVHHLKDGSTRETQPVVQHEPSVTVNDPFEEALVVEFFPNYDGANIQFVSVDVTYQDPAQSRPRVESLRFVGQTTESQRVRFARSNPSVGTFSFQITRLGADHSVRRFPAVTSDDTIIFLGEHMGAETIRERKRVMSKKAGKEVEAYAEQEKAYEQVQPQAAEPALDASLADEKAHLLNAFEQLVEAMVGAYAPAGSGAMSGGTGADGGYGNMGGGAVATGPGTPVITGGEGAMAAATAGAAASASSASSGGGVAVSAGSGSGATAPIMAAGEGAVSSGSGYGSGSMPAGYGSGSGATVPGSDMGSSSPGGGYGAAGPVVYPTAPAKGAGTNGGTNGESGEAFKVPVAILQESYRQDRARELAKKTRPETREDTIVLGDGQVLNKHTPDSNRAPRLHLPESKPGYGRRGQSKKATMEKMSAHTSPALRPEAEAVAASAVVPIDAYWASFGTAAERAQERSRVARKIGAVRQPHLETILGSDDRILVTNNEAYPWRCVCSLLIKAQTGFYYVGTGWLIGPRLVLTAGHNVYMADEGGWAEEIEVMPGRNADAKPFGSVIARDYRSVVGWTVNKDHDYDYAVIILPEDRRLGDELGWFGYAPRTDEYLRGITINLAGYPVDGGPDRREGTQWFNSRGIKDVHDKQISYEIDTIGGNSGGPVWELTADGSRYGVAIHAWGTSVVNGATRITQEVFDNLVMWAGEVP